MSSYYAHLAAMRSRELALPDENDGASVGGLSTASRGSEESAERAEVSLNQLLRDATLIECPAADRLQVQPQGHR
jgi:hypothetical protein